jgi:transposase
MIAVTSQTRIFMATQPVDLRKSFSGLHGIVRDVLKHDPGSGHLFIFTNKSRRRLKLYCWDGSGAWVATKRLSAGRFLWPGGDGVDRSLLPEDFYGLINGLKIQRLDKWYRR